MDGKLPRRTPQDMGALRADIGPGVSQDPTALTTQQLLRENFWLRELSEAKLDSVIGRIEAMDKAVQLLQNFADRTPTTMDVQKDVQQLREVAFEKFDKLTTQLTERDARVERVAIAVHLDVENAVSRLREVCFEKFDKVATQIVERDTQVDKAVKDVRDATEKAARDVKSAVDAAFAASKEVVSEQNKSNAAANDKSERAVTKQIDMLGDTIKVNTKGVDDKINDIKERITIIESKTSVSDPSSAIAISELKASVNRISSTTDITSGRGAGMTALWALIIGGIGALFGIASIVAVVVKMMK